VSDLSRDYAEGVDGLQADMAKHQRQFAGEVTADANRRLAIQAIELLEKQDAEKKSAPAAPAATPAPAPEVTTRTIEDRTYTRDVAPDKAPMYRTATEFEHQVLRHAMPRITRLMGEMDSGPLGSPSWHDKTLAAMFFKVKSLEARKAGKIGLAENYERAYQVDLQDLLEESNKSFGDWRANEPERLIISG